MDKKKGKRNFASKSPEAHGRILLSFIVQLVITLAKD